MLDFPPNQAVVTQDQWQEGPYRMDHYLSIVDADLTGSDTAVRVLGDAFIAYLDQYFPGWTLQQRVERHPARSKSSGSYKDVFYVLVLGSDADIETARSHIEDRIAELRAELFAARTLLPET
jgi:hypothetical protein